MNDLLIALTVTADRVGREARERETFSSMRLILKAEAWVWWRISNILLSISYVTSDISYWCIRRSYQVMGEPWICDCPDCSSYFDKKLD